MVGNAVDDLKPECEPDTLELGESKNDEDGCREEVGTLERAEERVNTPEGDINKEVAALIEVNGDAVVLATVLVVVRVALASIDPRADELPVTVGVWGTFVGVD